MEDIKYIQATSEHVNILVDLRIIFSNEMSGKQDKEAEANLRENLTNYFTNEINKSYLCWFATVNGEVSSIAGLGIRVQPGNYRNPSGIWGYIMSVYTLPQHRKKGPIS